MPFCWCTFSECWNANVGAVVAPPRWRRESGPVVVWAVLRYGTAHSAHFFTSTTCVHLINIPIFVGERKISRKKLYDSCLELLEFSLRLNGLHLHLWGLCHMCRHMCLFVCGCVWVVFNLLDVQKNVFFFYFLVRENFVFIIIIISPVSVPRAFWSLHPYVGGGKKRSGSSML